MPSTNDDTLRITRAGSALTFRLSAMRSARCPVRTKTSTRCPVCGGGEARVPCDRSIVRATSQRAGAAQQVEQQGHLTHTHTPAAGRAAGTPAAQRVADGEQEDTCRGCYCWECGAAFRRLDTVYAMCLTVCGTKLFGLSCTETCLPGRTQHSLTSRGLRAQPLRCEALRQQLHLLRHCRRQQHCLACRRDWFSHSAGDEGGNGVSR